MKRFYSTIVNSSNSLHPAYFTGNPFYFDVLLRVNGYIQRIQDFSSGSNLKMEKSGGFWMSSQELSEKLSIKTTEKEYMDLTQRLGFLYAHKDLFQDSESREIMDFLEGYMKPGSFLKKPVIEYPTLDEYHRSMTLGSKKTAKAQVWMIPGEGLVMVNGIHFSDYFDNYMEMQSAVKPFQIARCWGKYNVWALTNGGGKSSQSHAIGLGISRGLILQDATFKSILEENGLLKVDTRQVERKKTGQPKARKKITWVKR